MVSNVRAVAAAALVIFSASAAGQGSKFGVRFFGTGQSQKDRIVLPIDDNAPGPDASSPCDVGAGGFTIEFWLRGTLADNPTPNSGGDKETGGSAWMNGNMLVDRNVSTGTNRKWGISVAGGFIRFGTGRGDSAPQDFPNTIEGNVNVLDGAWHHVACVRDPSTGTKRIFVDGLLDFASSGGASQTDLSYPNNGVAGQPAWGPSIVFGAEKYDAPGGHSFKGFFDEVRIWSTARTPGQILEHFDRVLLPSEMSGLAGLYRLEEGSGTIVADTGPAISPSGVLVLGVPGNGEWASFAAKPGDTAPVSDGPFPPGFSRSHLAGGFQQPTVLEFLPDGRILVGERDGAVRVVQGTTVLPAPLLQVAVSSDDGEKGLLGLAVDPAFSSNGFVYVRYTTLEPRDRLSRFHITGNLADAGSETLIWQAPDVSTGTHQGGAVRFGVDGNLLIATGDRAEAVNSQTLANPYGKILRLTPTGAIPPSNPFVTTPGADPSIWAYGLRNPFRCSVDSLTGALWIADVGGNSFQSWEELDRGQPGANFGWPDAEGPDCYSGACAGFALPYFAYRHDDEVYAPAAKQGAIIAGPVYRGSTFPASYQGSVFVAEYTSGWIRRVVRDSTGGYLGAPLFVKSPDAGTIVDLRIGPDGALYYLTYGAPVGSPGTGVPDTPALYRIGYAGAGNFPPTPVASAAPATGLPTLVVTFGSAGSSDPNAGPSALTFLWDFGDGTASTLPNPAHAYSAIGTYAAVLTVSDGASSASSAPLLISVGNAPVPTITKPAAGTKYRAGDAILFEGAGMDVEDGKLADAAFEWDVILHEGDLLHPFYGPFAGSSLGAFLVPSSGVPTQNTFIEIRLTLTDSSGLKTLASRILEPVVSTLLLDTIPSGIPLLLDGETYSTPHLHKSVAGFQHDLEAPATSGGLAFQAWVGGGPAQTIFTAPTGGANVTAIYGTSPLCGYAVFGVDVSPANSLGLVGVKTPKPGTTVSILTPEVPGPGAWTLVTAAPASVPFFDGILLVDLASYVAGSFGQSSGGTAFWSLTIPNVPTLVGFTASLQSLALDPTKPQGVVFSNGLTLTICP